MFNLALPARRTNRDILYFSILAQFISISRYKRWNWLNEFVCIGSSSDPAIIINLLIHFSAQIWHSLCDSHLQFGNIDSLLLAQRSYPLYVVHIWAEIPKVHVLAKIILCLLEMNLIINILIEKRLLCTLSCTSTLIVQSHGDRGVHSLIV